MVQVKIHASMEPPEPEALIKPQLLVNLDLSTKDPVVEEPMVHELIDHKEKHLVPEPQQLLILPQKTIKPMVSEKPSPPDLPMPRYMPL